MCLIECNLYFLVETFFEINCLIIISVCFCYIQASGMINTDDRNEYGQKEKYGDYLMNGIIGGAATTELIDDADVAAFVC